VVALVTLASRPLVLCTLKSRPLPVHTLPFPSLLVTISFSWMNIVHSQAAAMHGVVLHRLSLLMDTSARCLASDASCSICKRKIWDARLVLVHPAIASRGHIRQRKDDGTMHLHHRCANSSMQHPHWVSRNESGSDRIGCGASVRRKVRAEQGSCGLGWGPATRGRRCHRGMRAHVCAADVFVV